LTHDRRLAITVAPDPAWGREPGNCKKGTW
jgi:hypothetical protein